MIIRQTVVLQRIVDEFSKFARMPEPQKKVININELIKSSVLLQKAVYDEIQFNLDLKGLNSKIFGDTAMLSQALTNLLKNAAESITSLNNNVVNNDGKIGYIDIITDVNNYYLNIKIIDTGVGLNKNITNFFEPYVTTKQNGTGLGLAIVRKIIEQHDGSLSLYNCSNVLHRKYNRGAVAEIKLPLVLNKNKLIKENFSKTDFQNNLKINVI